LAILPRHVNNNGNIVITSDPRSLAPTGTPVQRAVRKAAARLLPFLCLLYFVAYLDRVNVGFAALTMRRDLGLSDSDYGFGAGIFFLGYVLFEVPSNLMLKRFGARRWIARIVITWGLVSIAMAAVNDARSFWTLRFLLGVAEAGFFPGIILYLTFWFPNSARGAVIGYFLLANPLTTVVGAPLSIALLKTHVAGLAGWRTMFILEGIPAILLGIAVLFWLVDSPTDASWLDADESRALEAAVRREQDPSSHTSLRAALANPQVWLFGVIYLGLNLSSYGIGFWAPQLIHTVGGFTNTQTGFITAVLYACAGVAMFVGGRHSDRTRERVWHLTAPALLGSVGFVVGSQTGGVYLALIWYTVGMAGLYAALPVFWTLPASRLTGTAAAGGIALINSIGTLGGYFGPVIMGRLNQATGGYSSGLIVVAASLALAGLLNLAATLETRRNGS
jgi:ACS family tartrate transporter-like MFS transporter